MAGGLAAYLTTGSHVPMPLIIAGSLLFLAPMALFLFIIAADALRHANLSGRKAGPETGGRVRAG